MKAKKVALILVSILLLSILLVVILFLIALNSTNTGKIGKSTTGDEITNETNANTSVNTNTSVNSNIISNQNEIKNEAESETGFDFDPESGVDIFSEEELEEMRRAGIYEEVQEDGTKVESEEEINKIELEVRDLPDDVIENRVDRNTLVFELKKYLYENPQIKATEALYTEYKLVNQENRINDNFCFK